MVVELIEYFWSKQGEDCGVKRKCTVELKGSGLWVKQGVDCRVKKDWIVELRGIILWGKQGVKW